MNAPSLLAAEPACCADETWKPLPGWPHEASSCGRVRSVDRTDESGMLQLGQILPQQADKRRGKGYLYVMLRDGARRQRAAVAAVVLEAHRGARMGPDIEACHGPAGRTDNHLTNLRWDTKAANLAEMWAARRARQMAVTDTGGEPSQDTRVCHKPQVRRGVRLPTHLSQLFVTVTDRKAQGRLRPLPNLPFISSSLNPPHLSLRRLLRSLRDRRTTS